MGDHTELGHFLIEEGYIKLLIIIYIRKNIIFVLEKNDVKSFFRPLLASAGPMKNAM